MLHIIILHFMNLCFIYLFVFFCKRFLCKFRKKKTTIILCVTPKRVCNICYILIKFSATMLCDKCFDIDWNG